MVASTRSRIQCLSLGTIFGTGTGASRIGTQGKTGGTGVGAGVLRVCLASTTIVVKSLSRRTVFITWSPGIPGTSCRAVRFNTARCAREISRSIKRTHGTQAIVLRLGGSEATLPVVGKRAFFCRRIPGAGKLLADQYMGAFAGGEKTTPQLIPRRKTDAQRDGVGEFALDC